MPRQKTNRLIPAASADKAPILETIRKIKDFRQVVKLGGIPIREIIVEGRRRDRVHAHRDHGIRIA